MSLLSHIATLKLLSGQVTLAAGVVTNAMIAAAAGIPYSKLTLTGAVVGGDLAANIAVSSSGTCQFSGGYNDGSGAGVSKTLAQSIADGDTVSQGIINHPT